LHQLRPLGGLSLIGLSGEGRLGRVYGGQLYGYDDDIDGSRLFLAQCDDFRRHSSPFKPGQSVKLQLVLSVISFII